MTAALTINLILSAIVFTAIVGLLAAAIRPARHVATNAPPFEPRFVLQPPASHDGRGICPRPRLIPSSPGECPVFCVGIDSRKDGHAVNHRKKNQSVSVVLNGPAPGL